MKCSRCGNLLNENVEYCSICGKKVGDQIKNKSISLYSFYIMFLSSPILLIIRMINQVKRKAFGWCWYTYYTVPNNIRTVMVILFIILLSVSILLKKKSGIYDKKSIGWLIFGWLISGIVCMLTIFLEVTSELL